MFVKSRRGKVICGIDDANAMEGVIVYHAGTTLDDGGRVLTAGGRVLDVMATLCPTTALISDDFPTLGRPTSVTKPLLTYLYLPFLGRLSRYK